jgi:acyl-CoA thioester hydrolase
MYHGAYIDFFARARNEWAREVGFGIQEQNQRGICLVVHEISAIYHKPAKLDDLVEIETQLISASRIKIIFQQKLYRKFINKSVNKSLNKSVSENLISPRELLAEARVTTVCVDQKTLNIKRLSLEDLNLLETDSGK